MYERMRDTVADIPRLGQLWDELVANPPDLAVVLPGTTAPAQPASSEQQLDTGAILGLMGQAPRGCGRPKMSAWPSAEPPHAGTSARPCATWSARACWKRSTARPAMCSSVSAPPRPQKRAETATEKQADRHRPAASFPRAGPAQGKRSPLGQHPLLDARTQEPATRTGHTRCHWNGSL